MKRSGSPGSTVMDRLKAPTTVDMIMAGRKVHNILVELTPKWWPNKEVGQAMMKNLSDLGFTFISSAWSEHAARVGSAPHGVGVPASEWDSTPLVFAQHLSPPQVWPYIESIKYQRDFLLQHRDSPFKLDFLAERVDPLQCSQSADEWKYAPPIPPYLAAHGFSASSPCEDRYHKAH